MPYHNNKRAHNSCVFSSSAAFVSFCTLSMQWINNVLNNHLWTCARNNKQHESEKNGEKKTHQQHNENAQKCNGIWRKYWIENINKHTIFEHLKKKNRFCCVSAYSVSNINFNFFLCFFPVLLHMFCTLLVDKTHKIYLKNLFILFSILFLSLSLHDFMWHCIEPFSTFLILITVAFSLVWPLKLELMYFTDESGPISKLIKPKESWMIPL